MEVKILSRFYPRKSGNGYTTTFDAHLPVSKLKEAGFINEDGTVKEFNARVEAQTIVLEHIKSLEKND
jgi:hypothetical protein